MVTFLTALAGDPTIEALFSENAEIEAMLAFERALADAEAELGLIPDEAAAAIEAAARGFAPDASVLAAGVMKDGIIGPSFVASLRVAVGEPHAKWVHWGATSQDLVDTGLVLRLKQVVSELDARLSDLIARLKRLRVLQGDTNLMAQTRMQRALPFTAGDKIDTWLRPLERHRWRLAELSPRLLVAQLGGPVGTRSGLGGKGDLVAESLARRLDLGVAPSWHTARDGIAEFGSWLSLVSGALGKMGMDVSLMAQNEVNAVRLAEGGGSSAMPHKSNPVAAECLVALARFNAALTGALHQSLIHENERSGAAWTLEWLVLPQMAIVTAASLRNALRLADNLEFVSET